jgi:hypothetical protein
MAFNIGQVFQPLSAALLFTPAAPLAPLVAGAGSIIDGARRGDPWAIAQGVATAALSFAGSGDLNAFHRFSQTGYNMLNTAESLHRAGKHGKALQWHQAGLSVLHSAAQIAPGGWGGRCESVCPSRWSDLSALTRHAGYLSHTANTLGGLYGNPVTGYQAFNALHTVLNTASAWGRV